MYYFCCTLGVGEGYSIIIIIVSYKGEALLRRGAFLTLTYMYPISVLKGGNNRLRTETLPLETWCVTVVDHKP